jgi:hypothetical protein
MRRTTRLQRLTVHNNVSELMVELRRFRPVASTRFAIVHAGESGGREAKPRRSELAAALG